MIYVSLTVLSGPPGWIIGGIGGVTALAGGYGATDGLNDARNATEKVNEARRAAEHLRKYPVK